VRGLDRLTELHVRDIISLAAVLKGEKPAASLVVPLEAKDWFERFCEERGLVRFEERPSDAHQAWFFVCYDEEIAALKRRVEEFKLSLATVKGKLATFSGGKAYGEVGKALTAVEGAMYGYPECCVESYAARGPASRARAYEEFLERGRDQAIPIEFWAVAHAPCSSDCRETVELGKRYLDAVSELSESLREHVESRLLLPRFYQTGGGRFIEIEPLDYDRVRGELAVSREEFERDARARLPEPVEVVLCEVPRPYVLVTAREEPPYKVAFPNPDMVGTMWLAYTPGYGAYMVNAKTGRVALYVVSDKWIPMVGEEWRSKSNFRVYRAVKRGR
jgi:hypothetical protein